MTTLVINGKKVTVSDDFLALSPDEQNKAVDEIAASMGSAPAASGGEKPGPDGMTRAERIAAAKAGTLKDNRTPEEIGRQAGIDKAGELRMARGPMEAFAGNVAQGLTFGFADELASIGNPKMRERLREVRAADEMDYPKSTMAGDVTGGLAGSVVGALAVAPAAVAMAPATILGKVIAGAGAGGVLGAGQGALSGAGYADGENVRQNALSGAGYGAALGGLLGGAAPVVGAAARNVIERLRGKDTSIIAKTLGISNDAAKVLKPDIEALDFAAALKKLGVAGDNAMLADAGISTREALDAAITAGGKASRVGVEAVSGRAAEAGSRLGAVMDMVLGVPKGVKAVGKSIAERTAPARSKAYRTAYDTPIDYADDTGRNIEEVLSRVDSETLTAAVKEANAAMKAAGVKNKQIMAILDSKGDVTFKEMPNVQQLDEMKKGLDAVARAETDPVTGKISGKGLRAKKLAGELKAAISDAVPAYKTAVRLGGDKIATEEAMKTGRSLFSPATTRESVSEIMSGASVEAKDAARQGIREYIDDTLARVRRDYDNPDADTTETLRLLNTLSSRDAREKLVMVLGQAKADRLLKEIDAAGVQFGTRKAIAVGSATGRREARREVAKEVVAPGVIGNAARGQAAGTVRSFIQMFTRATPQADAARMQDVYAEVAKALTDMRGPQAEAALKLVQKAISGQPLKTAEAVRIGRLVGFGTALGGYQAGQQALTTP